MIPVNKRKIGICVLLSIVTFGIYQIYWEYLLVKNTRAIQKDDSSCTGEMLCLVFVPFYSLFWWFTRGKIVKDKFAEHGYSAIGNEIAYLILSIFGLAIVSMAIMQNDFNSLRSESTQSIRRSTQKGNIRPKKCLKQRLPPGGRAVPAPLTRILLNEGRGLHPEAGSARAPDSHFIHRRVKPSPGTKVYKKADYHPSRFLKFRSSLFKGLR